MTSDESEKCHAIIHSTSTAAAAIGGGMAQLPVTDSAALIPLQIGMVVALGKVFGSHLSDSAARGIVLGTGAGFVGRAASQILVGWIPGLGNAINASTAVALTEAIGWAAASKFDKERDRR